MDFFIKTLTPFFTGRNIVRNVIVMRAERPILLRFLNVLTSLNDIIIKRIVFLFLVKYIASGTLRI